MFFHCYPQASVSALHMHIVDLSETGPTYDYMKFKNLPARDVAEVLQREIDEIKNHKMKEKFENMEQKLADKVGRRRQ